MTAADGSLRTRAATRDDVALLAELAREEWDATAELGAQRQRGRKQCQMTEKRILHHGFGRQPYFHALIAELEGEPVGHLLYNFGYWIEEGQPFLAIETLFVRQAARRRGIGTALVDEAAAILGEAGGFMMFMQIWDTNIPATLFFCALGGTFVEGERTLGLKTRSHAERGRARRGQRGS